jgi:RNase P/RNase MRP subunit POP5
MRPRYLAIRIDSEGTFASEEFMKALWNEILRLYGEYGASRTSLTLVDYGISSKKAIIRTSHDALNMVRAALASLTKIGDNAMAVHVLSVSGTIKALRRKVN